MNLPGVRAAQRVAGPVARADDPVPYPDATLWSTGHAPISACIITFNEEERIRACIASLAFCDEVIVVDAHSSDRTRSLATQMGARVIERDWPGYRSQKEFAIRSAKHDWVLCLDADERVSPALRAEILAWQQRGFSGYAGCSLGRITEYFGRFLHHGNAYPDRLIRLFDRRRGGWRGYEVHENTHVRGPIRRLHGALEHYSYRSLTDQTDRLQHYARLMAQAMYAGGRRCGVARIIFNPLWCFTRGYLLRAGFLDGWRGLIFAYMEAEYVRHKYMRLYLLGRRLLP